MEIIEETPALRRLVWLLDALNGAVGWEAGVVDALAPSFVDAIPVDVVVDVTRRRAATHAPIRVVGVTAEGDTARARFRTRDGLLWASYVTVEPDPPHRIISTRTSSWAAPEGLTPALPADFSGTSPAAAAGAALIAFAGVPGSGKSTVADAVGVRLGVPVFAIDWLLGALTPFGGRHTDDSFPIGFELLTTLAYRQMALGQSAILDSPGEDVATRARWASLAAAAGAAFIPIVCVCTDATLHRSRVEGRVRGIPGWHDPGDWPNASARQAAFPPWPEALTVDTSRPLADCVDAVIDCLT